MDTVVATPEATEPLPDGVELAVAEMAFRAERRLRMEARAAGLAAALEEMLG